MNDVSRVKNEVPHITVCVCTYKRPQMLQRLLNDLAQQETLGTFTFSVVVADNDAERSAEDTVTRFSQSVPFSVKYVVEPEQSIARTRNMAVKNAEGDYIAFIDDDEFPIRRWLLLLLEACNRFEVDGVLGPVKRHFDEEPPSWILKGNFYDRRVNTTGSQVEWEEARTGNVLFKRELIDGIESPFRPEFRAGEDQDFFRRMIESGRRFVWSADAIAYEIVPPTRWTRGPLLRKALLRGQTAALQPSCDLKSIMKSIVAVLVYVLALPIALIAGQHRFMMLLVKLCDHLGKLLAVMGFDVIKEQYVIH
jgi:succinoglycan biosynthesis protein ExoM